MHTTAAKGFELPEQEVQIWFAWLEQPPLVFKELRTLLSADEKERAARFSSEEARYHFVVSRGLLRTLLGKYAGIVPAELSFCYGSAGKPALSPSHQCPIQFNLSHSAGLVVYAFALRRELGVDIEKILPIPEAEGIAHRLFSAEEAAALRNETERREEIFYRYWTRNEAILKCRGAGIPDWTQNSDHSFSGSTLEFEPVVGYMGALAVEGRPLNLKKMAWPDAVNVTSISANPRTSREKSHCFERTI